MADVACLDEHVFAPTLFDLTDPCDAIRFGDIVARLPSVARVDRLDLQIRELIKTRAPGERFDSCTLDEAVRDFVVARGGSCFGRWVYYPWLGSLFRVLPPAEFAELRTSRNRYKITAEEQARLAAATIGIVGLSAGHAIAVTLALERVGTKFRLADPDRFELSNMNRVSSGLMALGLNKAVVAARNLYEIDPYLQVEVFGDGIVADNVEQFMLAGGKLDLLVEECDDLHMKVLLREHARTHRVPVVMETNDRGMLDVERFDREPIRQVFHGLLEGTHSEALIGLDTERKTPFMLRILGIDMSSRLAASLIEIDKTIAGWPQLASGNALGGAVVVNAVRRILLDQFTSSGRFHVDLDAIVRGTGEPIAVESSAPPLRESDAGSARPVVVGATPQPSRAEIRWLVEQAVMAPSGANDQPWRFVWRGGRTLECYIDRERSGSFLDFERSASFLAIGAAAENAVIASSGLGRMAAVEPFPSADSDLVFTLTLGEWSPSVAPSAVLEAINQRATNRRMAERRPLDPIHARRLRAAARDRGADLVVATHGQTLSQIGALLGEVDRFRFSCERLHVAMMSELRWTAEDAAATRDGIDVVTLELDAVNRAGLRLLADPKTAGFLRSLGKGIGLERPARRAIDTASAVAVLSIEGTDARAHFQAGRAMQLVWLWATQLGLAIQPMAVAPYLFARLIRGAGEGFTTVEVDRLTDLQKRFSAMFPVPAGTAQPMLFRIAHALPPTARALRRPVDAVLTEVGTWD